MNIPLTTYRIQFTPSFGFSHLTKVLPYLNELGISHIYASPIFKSRKGSLHGYDVVNPLELNPELGTEKEFLILMDGIKKHEMGWIQDIVPNHMAFDSENKMLMDIFENGKNSFYYQFFDIDWNHPLENMKGKVLTPFLGKFYAEALENGEIQLRYDNEEFEIQYYQHRFPLKIESYFIVLERNLDLFEERLGAEHPDTIKYLGTLDFFKTIKDVKVEDNRKEQIRHAKKMLKNLYTENQNIRGFINENITFFNGQKGNPDSYNQLDQLISEQFFRLSFWKVAAEEINYRRFFTVNDLISLKVEEDAVFAYTHQLILQMVQQNLFQGLRIDHIDGLFDPKDYLDKLRSESGEELYLIIEKILEFGEEIPNEWPVQGTTGYEFMNHLNGIFCNREHKRSFSRIYHKFSGLRISFEELLSNEKRLIIGKHLAGNIDNLANELKRISSNDRYGRDITLYGLKRTIVELMSHFSVYRTYITQNIFSKNDQNYLRQAIEKSRDNLPLFHYEFNFIEKFLLLKFSPENEELRKQSIQFIMSLQQFTGALMAKGFEDTFLYIFNRLLSLNEVGGFPDRFGIELDVFHDFNKKRCSLYPYSLNATSTHDTKRGEDVRARINVLSEIPNEWERHLKKWQKINKRYKISRNEQWLPDANDEYFLYQTLLGAYPFTSESLFMKRIKEYLVKAVREAKVHTAWIKPDLEYETAYVTFFEQIMQPNEDNFFMKEFIRFQKKIAFYGILNSLSQILIKMTAPGVPDFYQGTETWDLNLVDPDNRNPVDFEKRNTTFQEIKRLDNENCIQLLNELWSTNGDGRIKQFLIYKILKTRKEFRELFTFGEYMPLHVSGKFNRNIIAYARKFGEHTALVLAPRFFTMITEEGKLPFGTDVWQDTRVLLPENCPKEWNEIITGRKLNLSNGTLFIGDCLENCSISLLIGKK